MLTCKGDGCSRDGTSSSGYCCVCQAERDEVFEHGGMLDGVHFEPRRAFTRETFHPSQTLESRPVDEDEPAVPSDHRFGLRRWGRGYVWTREAAFSAVREYVEAVGRQPNLRDVLLEPVGQLPSENSAKRLFGSWDALLEEAGGCEPAPAPPPERSPVVESVEPPVDVMVELVGCAHEIERLEASLATVRDRYHGLLDQLRDVV